MTWFPQSAAKFKQLFGAATTTNYLSNSGFETGNLSGWNLWVGSNGAAASAAGAAAHTGSYGYNTWSPSAYEMTVYQQVTVPNGTRTITAWVKSSGGQTACQMLVKYHGGAASVINIPATSTWTQKTITVSVTTGTLEVSFYTKAAANQWLNVDDVFVK